MRKTWNAKDKIKKSGIMSFIAYNFGKPKRYKQILDYVRLRRLCSKKTLRVYLDKLIEEGKIKKVVHSHKNVTYELVISEKERKRLGDLEKKMKDVFEKEMYKLGKYVRQQLIDVQLGEFSSEEIEKRILSAWRRFQNKAIFGLSWLTEAKGQATFISYLVLDYWVLSPFLLISTLTWEFHHKYPEEVESVLENLRKQTLG